MLVRVGGPRAAIVNGTVLLVPAEVATATLIAPGAAVCAMLKVALMNVLLVTVTPLTVTPLPSGTMTLASLAKFVPVKVAEIVAPWSPVAGEMLDSTGTLLVVTLKFDVEVDPAGVVTVISTGPGAAVGAMVRVALIWEGLGTVTPPTVTPRAGGTVTVAPGIKWAPSMVMGTVVPGAPDTGATDEIRAPASLIV
jgi:hypothetical protein